MSTEAILTSVRQFLGVDPTVPVTLEPIKRGASGRTVVRVKTPLRDSFIGVHWTAEREDNDRFVPAARMLRQAGLRVPEILLDQPRYRVALVEDLGDESLHCRKEQPFAGRLPLYESAMRQIDRLFFAKVPKDFELMPPFDAGMYRWEQEYFFDHLVEDHLGMDAGFLRGNPVFSEQAAQLGAVSRHLVHRDFQSQNLMVRGNEVWMIDFQGLRRGRQEYDLASLIYDPYMDHDAEQREALLDLWEEISEERPEEGLFRQCAAQRLMQAMGAYGNILRQRGDEWYRPHIRTAARLLEEVVDGTPLEKPLSAVFAALR
jgi:aminoglycoside/choline kinase family phosphotransferase